MDTVPIPKALQRKLRRISEQTGQRPEQLVATALEDRLQYEEWVLRRIDAGLSDLKAGRVLASRIVGQMLQQRMRESQKYEEAMRRFLEKKPVRLNRSGKHYPKRDVLP